MIVDLVRNDLGGFVRRCGLKKMFEIENTRHVSDDSSIAGKLKKHQASKIFLSIFRRARLPGAPKIKTMQLITILIGNAAYFIPARSAILPLKTKAALAWHSTVELEKTMDLRDRRRHRYDSVPESEYKRRWLKAKFLTRTIRTLNLIETFLWRRPADICF